LLRLKADDVRLITPGEHSYRGESGYSQRLGLRIFEDLSASSPHSSMWPILGAETFLIAHKDDSLMYASSPKVSKGWNADERLLTA
jgi:hypothetical protein